MNPLITIITSVYNGGSSLEKSILSVIRQDYDNIEYIIIDGGSTDESVKIIRNYQKHITYWISEPDNGIYDAWNKALQISNGEWIAFLGSDDYYKINAISTYVVKIKENNNCNYISSRVQLISNQKKHNSVIGEKWRWDTFSRYMNVAHVGSLHHHSLFKEFGWFDTSFKIAGDYEFLLRPGKNLRVDFVDKVLCEMESSGLSSTSRKVFRETTRAKMKNKSRPPILCLLDEMFARFIWEYKRLLKL